MGRQVVIDVLNPSSITDAIKALERVIDEEEQKFDRHLQEVLEYGYELAKKNFEMYASGLGTGRLLDEIYFEYSPKTRTGRIVSGAPYTSYFEYGTGSVGQLNPHPDATGEWTYTTEGWWYTPDDGETFIWTYGQASKPFLWLTRMELEDRYGAQSRP